MTDVHEVHKHLYHYTNFGGLKGILETHTLWATHFRHLNDSSEIEVMRPLLEEKLFEIINANLSKKEKENVKYRRFLENLGGITEVSRGDAIKIIDSYYKMLFLGSPGMVPAAEPYILSFCTHTTRDDYVKKNGLLSQWRAYGGDGGGYALVFDTKRLGECLKAEAETYNYSISRLMLSDVVYDNQSDKFESEFANFFKDLDDMMQPYILEGKIPDFENHRPPSFFSVATRFKHRGFEEECEVRVSTSPVTEEIVRENSFMTPPARMFKPILLREKDGSQIRYIALNDGPNKKPLPIIRIIIGPQRDQLQREKDVKLLVGKKNIPIVCSETPYIPPQGRISG